MSSFLRAYFRTLLGLMLMTLGACVPEYPVRLGTLEENSADCRSLAGRYSTKNVQAHLAYGPDVEQDFAGRLANSARRTVTGFNPLPAPADSVELVPKGCEQLHLVFRNGSREVWSLALDGWYSGSAFVFKRLHYSRDASMVVGPEFNRASFQRTKDGALIYKSWKTISGLALFLVPVYTTNASWYRMEKVR